MSNVPQKNDYDEDGIYVEKGVHVPTSFGVHRMHVGILGRTYMSTEYLYLKCPNVG